jgi:glycosyltransferase involved in cell wall biosynthesis
MKIGLYGGMANNMYVFAKSFVKQGVKTCFIRDRSDHYPFSQPVWEDVRATLDYDDVAKASSWSWQEWKNWEAEVGWKAPDWLADPLEGMTTDGESPRRGILFAHLARRHPYRRVVIDLMANCDCLLVCGIEGTILAKMSGKPYVIWPHGGDIRKAAGLQPPQSWHPRIWLNYWLVGWLLRRAYRGALWIGTHDPKGIGRHIGDTTSKFQIEFLGIPLPLRRRLPKEERRKVLADLMKDLGLAEPKADWIGFIPSRIDFFWKGTDLLFRAIRQWNRGHNLHLIASGWGEDYRKAKEMIPAEQITFLPCTVSKPILYEFYGASDFVADQFLLGTYGTAAVEAMSCGTPVMMWIDEKAFRTREWTPPPVLNARGEQEILRLLGAVISGGIDLEAQGQLAQEWVAKVHRESIVILQFLARLSERLPALSQDQPCATKSRAL